MIIIITETNILQMYFVTETISEIISMSTKKIGLVSGADLFLSRAYDSENVHIKSKLYASARGREIYILFNQIRQDLHVRESTLYIFLTVNSYKTLRF